MASINSFLIRLTYGIFSAKSLNSAISDALSIGATWLAETPAARQWSSSILSITKLKSLALLACCSALSCCRLRLFATSLISRFCPGVSVKCRMRVSKAFLGERSLRLHSTACSLSCDRMGTVKGCNKWSLFCSRPFPRLRDSRPIQSSSKIATEGRNPLSTQDEINAINLDSKAGYVFALSR